jgi:hypothetical protein
MVYVICRPHLTPILTASKPSPNSLIWVAPYCGGSGRRGCFICSYEDLLHKNGSYTNIIITSSLKMTFFCKTPETKKFADTFIAAFLILRQIVCYAIQNLFPFFLNRNLNSQVVRIRVNRQFQPINRVYKI